MKKARDEFIDLLIQYRNIKMHDITVVFDGYKNGIGVGEAAVRGNVEVIYSDQGRADDVIKGIISKERREWIVVSSDRDIVRHAWHVNSIPVPSDRFLELILKQLEKKRRSEEDKATSKKDSEEFSYINFKDNFEVQQSQKGNPYRLSKKDKAVRRAMNKL